jgi:hypothetical protein
VIRGVGYGKWGNHEPGLYFETWQADGATLQLMFGAAAARLLAQAGASTDDVSRLEGRSCLVEVDGYRVIFNNLTPAA